jgi:hypothetical protein
VPAAALAATACAVTARVQRLLEPARRARRAGYGLALITLVLLLALAPALAAAFADALTAHGIAVG